MISLTILLCSVMDSHAASPPERSVTVQEPTGISQHVYTADHVSQKTQPRSGDRSTLNHWPILWLFDVTITLNQDYDGDGYHSNFTITFDFDTYLESRLVYAVLYVDSGNGQWIEYAVTGNFTVGNSGPGDAYTIHANLDSGYQPGHYDHFIEIYDAYSHDFLAGFGPADSHVLHALPIESTPHDYHRGISSSVSLQFSGTGATGPLSLIFLTLIAAVRTGQRRAKS